MLLSKNQEPLSTVMKDTKTLALTFLALMLALPRAGADVPISWPLAELKLGDGQPPRIETTQDGFRVADAVRIHAQVQAPADAFLCRVERGRQSGRRSIEHRSGGQPALQCVVQPRPRRGDPLKGARVELVLQATVTCSTPKDRWSYTWTATT